MNNKYRFWTGAAMIGSEVLGIGIFLLTLINWNFITTRILVIGVSVLFLLLFNVLATILVWSGSKEEKHLKRK